MKSHSLYSINSKKVNMSRKEIILFLFSSFLFVNSLIAQSNNIVLRTNFDGQIVEGSIDSLIRKISEGKELRIGWQLDFDNDGKSDIEHWINASFISILNGHVFNQIQPIYRQVPKKEKPQVEIINSNMKWTGIIGTNSKLISRYIIPDLHLIEDEAIRERFEKIAEIKERIVATVWVLKDK